jgi:hypothetical protein
LTGVRLGVDLSIGDFPGLDQKMEHNDAFLLHHSLFTLRIVSSQHALQVFLLLPVIPEADEGQNTLVDVFSSDLSASECKVLYSAIGGKSGTNSA